MKVSTKKTMILAILAVLLTAATWIRISEEKNLVEPMGSFELWEKTLEPKLQREFRKNSVQLEKRAVAAQQKASVENKQNEIKEKNQELIQMSEKEEKEIRNTYYEHELVVETFGEIEVEYIADENLIEGEEICKREGSYGEVNVEYELKYEQDNFIEKYATGNKEVISNPVSKIVHYGTQSIGYNYDRNMAVQILNFTNMYRSSYNLAPYIWDESLYQAAQVRAKEISELFSHTRPNGSAWDSVSEDVMGENLAYGYRAAQQVVDAWVASPTHQENLIRAYTHMVSAVYVDESGQIYVSQLFSYR